VHPVALLLVALVVMLTRLALPVTAALVLGLVVRPRAVLRAWAVPVVRAAPMVRLAVRRGVRKVRRPSH